MAPPHVSLLFLPLALLVAGCYCAPKIYHSGFNLAWGVNPNKFDLQWHNNTDSRFYNASQGGRSGKSEHEVVKNQVGWKGSVSTEQSGSFGADGGVSESTEPMTMQPTERIDETNLTSQIIMQENAV